MALLIVPGDQPPADTDTVCKVAKLLADMLHLELVDGHILRIKATRTHYVDVWQTMYNWRLSLTPKAFPNLFDKIWCYTGRFAFSTAYAEAVLWPEGDDGTYVPGRWYRNPHTDERHREHLHRDGPDPITDLFMRAKPIGPVQVDRWYPQMPPGLPGESDGEYTDRLTGADRSGRIPYDHRRYRQCSIGWHGECSDPAGQTCKCPCHTAADPGRGDQ